MIKQGIAILMILAGTQACITVESGINVCESRAQRDWMMCKNQPECHKLYVELLARCDRNNVKEKEGIAQQTFGIQGVTE